VELTAAYAFAKVTAAQTVERYGGWLWRRVERTANLKRGDFSGFDGLVRRHF
jgi:hypothetical protein